MNGIKYVEKKKVYGIGQKDERLIGKSFLVVYRINDPSESDLNMDYHIESKAKLQQLKDEFVNNPPKPGWPKCK